MKPFSILSLILFPAALLTLAGCPGDGDDPPTTPTQPPNISIFSAVPADINPGDSTLITYKVSGADSVKLQPSGDKLTPTDSGQVYLKPALPTLYSLLGYNKGGKDSAAVQITMTGAMPVIDNFTLSDDTILIADSTTLNWATTRADSIVLVNGLSMARTQLSLSGSTVLKPSADNPYTGIAYNDIGTDTAQVNVRVENPVTIQATYGSYFIGAMGSGGLSPDFSFRVLDGANKALRLPWINFELLNGDGTLAADSGRPANGSFLQDYDFSGVSGHALVRAFVRDIDTVEVKVRASTLQFGSEGQGQYVTVNDLYSDVLALNSTPASVDPDPNYWINYANYESALGLVVAIRDASQDEVADAGEEVSEIIVNTVFDRQSADGVGVGSDLSDLRSAYGDADSTWYDPAPPAAQAFRYASMGALFYTTVSADSTVFEIHLWDPAGASPPGTAMAAKQAVSASASSPAVRYRRMVR